MVCDNKSVQNFCFLYKKGSSLRSISEKTGFSVNTVKKYLLLKDVVVKCKESIYGLKSQNDVLIGLYIGIWSGDGTQYYDKGYRIKICCHSDNQLMIDFFKFVLNQLFGKKVTHTVREKHHRGLLRFNSKFIYNFVYNYIKRNENKTHSVCLRNKYESYSSDFLKGFVLGLTLTDGYLKERFFFNVTSKGLAENVYDILRSWDFCPNHYVHNRVKYGWKNLHMVSLTKSESKKLLSVLDSTLNHIGYSRNFKEIKYGKNMGPP